MYLWWLAYDVSVLICFFYCENLNKKRTFLYQCISIKYANYFHLFVERVCECVMLSCLFIYLYIFFLVLYIWFRNGRTLSHTHLENIKKFIYVKISLGLSRSRFFLLLSTSCRMKNLYDKSKRRKKRHHVEWESQWKAYLTSEQKKCVKCVRVSLAAPQAQAVLSFIYRWFFYAEKIAI